MNPGQHLNGGRGRSFFLVLQPQRNVDGFGHILGVKRDLCRTTRKEMIKLTTIDQHQETQFDE